MAPVGVPEKFRSQSKYLEERVRRLKNQREDFLTQDRNRAVVQVGEINQQALLPVCV